MKKSGRPREFNRPEVLDAAMDVFWQKGYEGCSTEDLCTKTGIGRGSLYNAFGSKHELYEQTLQRYHEQGIQEQTAILERPLPAKERLRALLDWAVKQDFGDADNKGCMLINATLERARTDPMVEKIASRHVMLLDNLLCHVIEQGLESGEIASGRPALELARTFLSSYYGMRILNASARDRHLADNIVEGTLASIF